MADLYAGGATESTAHAVDRAYLRETCLAHMNRVTAEVRTEGTGRWIASYIQRRRGYRLPGGLKLRKELLHERKAIAGRYYQLLSGRSHRGVPLQPNAKNHI